MFNLCRNFKIQFSNDCETGTDLFDHDEAEAFLNPEFFWGFWSDWKRPEDGLQRRRDLRNPGGVPPPPEGSSGGHHQASFRSRHLRQRFSGVFSTFSLIFSIGSDVRLRKNRNLFRASSFFVGSALGSGIFTVVEKMCKKPKEPSFSEI